MHWDLRGTKPQGTVGLYMSYERELECIGSRLLRREVEVDEEGLLSLDGHGLQEEVEAQDTKYVQQRQTITLPGLGMARRPSQI